MILTKTTNFIIDISALATCLYYDRLPLTFMLESGYSTFSSMLYAKIFLRPQFYVRGNILTHTKSYHNMHTFFLFEKRFIILGGYIYST
jgi:hypothetical protein